ncbi:MAG: hypothetical protein EXX96DRAFT_613404 [Benjaminiella poitrasii]|nr:MAG: hypothetical protein EXX96DRAFT_613404 [Benjaminiella poitrasii]
MDATHGISSRSSNILYSLVARNPKTGYGNLIAYLITNDHLVEPIKNWLVSFKQRNVMNPNQITADCSIPKIDAIRVVSGDVLKTTSTMTDEIVKLAVKRTRGLMSAELKTIMYEVDPTAVKQKIDSFQNRWNHTQREFVNYFIDIWVNTFGCDNWIAAFMQEALNYMRTNNYIEDMKLEEQRVELEVGRMGLSVRQRRRREILDDKIPADEREKMVEQVEDGYVVESFEEEDITYQIKVIDGEIRSCECQYFRYRRKACEHMFLLKLYNRSLNMFTEEAQQLQTVATNINTIESAESSAEEHTLDLYFLLR